MNNTRAGNWLVFYFLAITTAPAILGSPTLTLTAFFLKAGKLAKSGAVFSHTQQHNIDSCVNNSLAANDEYISWCARPVPGKIVDFPINPRVHYHTQEPPASPNLITVCIYAASAHKIVCVCVMQLFSS